MALSAQKLVAIVNLLSDPGSAGNAAAILAREAKACGVLVADLIATIAPPASAAPPAAPQWQEVEGPYVQRVDFEHVGLVSEIIAETPKAWCAITPNGDEAWFAKSVVENHGEDHCGRTILIVPRWRAKKIGLAP
jgi:hypothetical protein